MKLEVGIYVRTINGDIVKISEDEKLVFIDFMYKMGMFYESQRSIKKASFNLIDLIEVGDYVNGFKVYEIQENADWCNINNGRCYIGNSKLGYREDFKQEIKSILTHELFEANCYKVVE